MGRRRFMLSGMGAALTVAARSAGASGALRQAAALSSPFRQASAGSEGHPGWHRGGEGLYAPARNLFVADRFSNFISVTDIVTGQHLATLDFGMRPQVMELARDDAMMAVGSPEVSAIHFMNLRTGAQRRVALPSPVYQIFFVPQSTLVAVGLRDQVGMIDYRDFSVQIFARRFDSPRRETLLDTFYSLLFSSFSRSFWVLDEEAPRIYHRLAADDGLEGAWETVDLSGSVSSGSGLGVGVASPEDDLLAMTTDDGSEGLVYFPDTGKVLSTGPMRTSGTTNEPMIMPYIDVYSKHVIFADMQGHVALFDLAAGGGRPERFVVDFSPRFIRSGWLEQIWILAGDRGLMFQSFGARNDRQTLRFVPEVMDIWVTGDSKTVLYSLDEGAPLVYRYDLRSRVALSPIRIRGVSMARMLRMGSNNSICY